MRTKNSIKNIITSATSSIFTMLIGFVSQMVFLKVFNSEYLGVNGFFSNIISLFGVVELGIGTAIIYSMYKPLAMGDNKKVSALMRFYKKAYRIIAIIIFAISLLFIPFIKPFMGDISIDINIYYVYFLFVLDILFSYLLSYKRNLLYADQKNYIVNIVHISYLIVFNGIQILFLLMTHNYYLYLIIKVIFRLLENIVISLIVDKRYRYIDTVSEIDPKTKNDILKKTKALFFHKIAGVVVNSTDNIIISNMLGVIYVGLYSNYFLIINSVQTLLNQIVCALIPSIGNLIAVENKEKQFDIFKKTRFMTFVVSCISSICILLIMDEFITVWIGPEYVLPKYVLMALVLNFFSRSMRNAYINYKEAAGIFYEDRFVPLFEAAINIVASVLLCKYFGMAGVFMGTVISSLVLWCYSYPKYVYKKLFNQSYRRYFAETILYLMLFILLAFVCYSAAALIKFNIIMNIIIKLLLAVTIPSILIMVVFIKSDYLKFAASVIKKTIKSDNKNQ